MKRARTSSISTQADYDLIEDTMPARRFVPKSTRPKMPWSTYKKKRSSNVSRWTRGLGAHRQADASVRVLNPMRMRPVRVQKTANWSVCASFTSTTPIAAYYFDPSGSFGNAGNLGGGVQMPDWSSFTALYDQYKVNSITINLTLQQQGTILGAVPLLMNKNYERSVVTPNVTGLAQLTGTIQKTFTQDSPNYTYTFRPVVSPLVDNASVLATEARGVAFHDWTDVNYPAELFGFQLASGYALSASQSLIMDITYDVSFRYTK